jgi:hypothetical protein
VRSPKPTKKQIEAAIADNAALEKVQRTRPRWEDYVSEGVIDHAPEMDPDGQARVSVSGHGKVVRMLQMNEEANRLASWNGDNRAEAPGRVARREERAEKKARKFHRASASIVVPEMPWKRKRRKGSA